MRTLLLCTAIAFVGFGITDRAEAQRGGWGHGGYYSGHGYYGGQGYYGGNYNHGYGYGNYSYAYPFLGNGYGNSYVYPSNFGSTYRDSYYPLDYSANFNTPTYQQNQPTGQTVIRVKVADPDTVVLFDGHKTSSLGRERTFHPPQLEAGYTYSYHVTASWMKDGREVKEARTVSIIPGQASVVDFTRAAPGELVAPPAKTKTPQS